MKDRGSTEGSWWGALKRGQISSAFSSIIGVPNAKAEQIAFMRSTLKEQRKPNVLYTPFQELEVVVFDLETTGFLPNHGDEIISIGAVKVRGDQVLETETFYTLVQANQTVSPEIEQLTGITNDMLLDGVPLSTALQQFMKFVGSDVLVAHASGHDKAFLISAFWKIWRARWSHRLVDTMMVAKWLEAESRNYTLDELLRMNDVPITTRHHALEDAKMTAELWAIYIRRMRERQVTTLGDLYAYLSSS
ncbi:DNA polymerase III subunit epsilon [Paenibacillus selenitireducens]|uniref:DNA polymerase III subunit epsilon n=1 Tax=Paenibacillus selenitireducens TaxID=1324314 RepID=A0A1T2XMN9_9BACL|nr:exonuclease domain-containing protein [Paenibacillus selenitireducens]OPA81134.1 DNA polymerase III subunit epsilon [Paenibacillus selenitireducens]